MKNLTLLLMASLTLLVSSCSTFNSATGQALALTAVRLTAYEVTVDNPESSIWLLGLASAIRTSQGDETGDARMALELIAHDYLVERWPENPGRHQLAVYTIRDLLNVYAESATNSNYQALLLEAATAIEQGVNAGGGSK